jgi:hypothetical protein
MDDAQVQDGEDAPAPLSVQRKLARTVISPAVNANLAVKDWAGLRGTPIDRGLLLELETQIAAIQAGNLDRPTALLAAHMETLNAVFYGLVHSAFEYRGNPYQEEKVRLALRVQAQMRATIEAIADLKNPRSVAFVQQANIGSAVQVNNCAELANKIQNAPNKLLEEQYEKWLDAGAMQAAISGDQNMEAMGSIHGTTNSRR